MKRIFSILVLILSLSALVSHAAEPEDYNGYTERDVEAGSPDSENCTDPNKGCLNNKSSERLGENRRNDIRRVNGDLNSQGTRRTRGSADDSER